MSRAPFYAASMRSVCHPVGPDDWGNSFVEHPELPHDSIAGRLRTWRGAGLPVVRLRSRQPGVLHSSAV